MTYVSIRLHSFTVANDLKAAVKARGWMLTLFMCTWVPILKQGVARNFTLGMLIDDDVIMKKAKKANTRGSAECAKAVII